MRYSPLKIYILIWYRRKRVNQTLTTTVALFLLLKLKTKFNNINIFNLALDTNFLILVHS